MKQENEDVFGIHSQERLFLGIRMLMAWRGVHMKKRLMVFLMSAVMVMTGLTACGESAEEDTIKIGFAGPLTGDCSQDGIACREATLLAIEEVNNAGGIEGKMVEAVVYDDKSDPKEAAIVANKIAEDSSILGVVGHYNSSCTLAGAPIYNKAQVTEVAYGSSAPAVTDAGDYTFRVLNSDDMQGALVADWAVNELGYKNCAIIYENSDYGLGNAESFKNAVLEYGATITTEDSYITGQTKDFTSILTNIKNSDAEMIFVGGLYNECAMLLKQAETVGLDIQMMSTDGVFSPSLIELAGEAGEGFLLIGTFHLENPAEICQNFINGYEEMYDGKEPGTYAAMAYDATRVLLDALKNGCTDREAVRQYLSTMKNFPGAAGDITFDENGDVVKEPLKLIIKSGEYALYK